MLSRENLSSQKEEGNCKNCKFRGITLQNVKVYCNQVKMFVNFGRCEHYQKEETEDISEKLAQKSPSELEVEKKPETIENESLNKILYYFTTDSDWTKLRRVLTKDIISTTVFLNYLEHNSDAKKKFMNALVLMAKNELNKLDNSELK